MKFVMVLSAIAALMFIVEGAKAETACEVLNRDMPGACGKAIVIASGDVTVASCLEAFSTSQAAQSCTGPQAWVKDGNRCRIRAVCNAKDWVEWLIPEITVPFHAVDNLRNCSGHLKLGSCP